MIAVDTNLLVHAHQREASLHKNAKACLRNLAESPVPWAVCLHGFVEFYGVVTNPRVWKKPSSPAEAVDQILAWRESPSLRVLCDSPGVLGQLSQLVVSSGIRGAMVHDARIAASCLVAGVRELWTVDRDFSRFPSLNSRNPLAG